MTIDKNKARQILEEEAQAAKDQAVDESWTETVNQLWQECQVPNKTFIAMLGTAILAKATDIQADPFALQSGLGTPGAYSARTLCKDVLAAESVRLEIDLGVSGREPLNNQPFFAKSKVSEELPVEPQGRAALKLLLGALQKVAEIKTPNGARLALRSFIAARKKVRKPRDISSDRLDHLTAESLTDIVTQFVQQDSESGKRAQAVAAGLLDILASPELVKVGRVHDPDQRFPGDVGVLQLASQSDFERSFEVRDKPVADSDLYHFVRKAAESGVTKAGVLAVSASQVAFDTTTVVRWAHSEGVLLVVYFSWRTIIDQVLFWSNVPTADVLRATFVRIHERAREMEVSEVGLDALETLAGA